MTMVAKFNAANVNSHIYQQRFSLQRLKSVSQNVNGRFELAQVRKFCATLNSA